MHITLDLHPTPLSFKSEKTIFKFISTLSSLPVIKKLSSKNQLVSGLKERRAKLVAEMDIETYQKIVYPKLGIKHEKDESVIEQKQVIALQYANILKKYKPDNAGNVRTEFNYIELVMIIRKVFKAHIWSPEDIYTGIALSTKKNHFYAKVKEGNISIVIKTNQVLGNGASGVVYRVYEIATCQFWALKLSYRNNFSSASALQVEIANLQKIQKLMTSSNLQCDGIQGSFLVDFILPKKHFVGYLSHEYDMDLIKFLDGSSMTNFERITLCRRLMRLFIIMDTLDIWHGDIKPDNIMLKNNQPIIIDWTGLLFYKDAAAAFSLPIYYTRSYYNRIDLLNLLTLVNERNPYFSNEFIKSAKSLELFSMAIVFYMTLTSRLPFEQRYDRDLNLVLPNTSIGMNISHLTNKNYSLGLINLMQKMLAHDPNDRYLIAEAASIWEKVDS